MKKYTTMITVYNHTLFHYMQHVLKILENKAHQQRVNDIFTSCVSHDPQENQSITVQRVAVPEQRTVPHSDSQSETQAIDQYSTN